MAIFIAASSVMYLSIVGFVIGGRIAMRESTCGKHVCPLAGVPSSADVL
jgi:hypothetical protein